MATPSKSNSEMKWLVVGPDRQDTFANNLADALLGMGHKVMTMPTRRLWGKLDQVQSIYIEARERTSATYLSPDERWILRTAREWRPDILLAPTQIVSDTVLAQVKAWGVRKCVAWWADPPGNMKRMGLASNCWDIIFFKDREAVRKFRGVGLNAHLMHEAINPRWHKRIAEQANDRVVVAGSYYGLRQFIVAELMKRGVEFGLYGPPPPIWALEEIKKHHMGRYIAKEEKSRVFGEGLACLNSTSPAEGDSLNCRAFEIAGAGGLQMLENRDIVSHCFEPGKEVLTYSSLDEIMGHIEMAKAAPDEARKIRMSGARRALAEHTYQHRIKRIVAMLSD